MKTRITSYNVCYTKLLRAEAILIPEAKTLEKELDQFLKKGYKEKDRSGIVIVAEGGETGRVIKIAKAVEDSYPNLDVRVSILGHIQRGGKPSARDRIAATKSYNFV